MMPLQLPGHQRAVADQWRSLALTVVQGTLSTDDSLSDADDHVVVVVAAAAAAVRIFLQLSLKSLVEQPTASARKETMRSDPEAL